MYADIFRGILIPFLGTALGAACVFFMKRTLSTGIQRALTGFAAGIMTAASVWSLLIPAMEQSADMGKLAFLPAVIGFLVGILFLLGLDHLIPHLHMNSSEAEGPKSKLKKTTMLVLAVTLHNIPEGMAVGVVYAGWASGNVSITAAAAMALSIGIAIQNFPEGAIISMPLRAEVRWQTGLLPRSDYFHAAAGRGHGKGQGIFVRYPFRRGGTHWGDPDDSGGRAGAADSAVSVELRRRCHDLCGSGGTDSGNVGGTSFQCGNDFFRRGICPDDDVGRGVGIMEMAGFLWAFFLFGKPLHFRWTTRRKCAILKVFPNRSFPERKFKKSGT